jgi:hypothetical protein
LAFHQEAPVSAFLRMTTYRSPSGVPAGSVVVVVVVGARVVVGAWVVVVAARDVVVAAVVVVVATVVVVVDELDVGTAGAMVEVVASGIVSTSAPSLAPEATIDDWDAVDSPDSSASANETAKTSTRTVTTPKARRFESFHMFLMAPLWSDQRLNCVRMTSRRPSRGLAVAAI